MVHLITLLIVALFLSGCTTGIHEANRPASTNAASEPGRCELSFIGHTAITPAWNLRERLTPLVRSLRTAVADVTGLALEALVGPQVIPTDIPVGSTGRCESLRYPLASPRRVN